VTAYATNTSQAIKLFMAFGSKWGLSISTSLKAPLVRCHECHTTSRLMNQNQPIMLSGEQEYLRKMAAIGANRIPFP
jgi:hypothetical protein